MRTTSLLSGESEKMNQTFKGIKFTNKEVVDKYLSFCAEGDLKKARHFLLAIKKPGVEILKFIKRVENRFFSDPPRLSLKTQVPWIRAVLRSYSLYFVGVLTRRISREMGEKLLFKNLCEDFPSKHFKDLDDLESFLQKEFERVGWFFLGGVTYPFRGPYIFEEIEKRSFNVQLPLGKRKLKVVFLSKKHCNSWMDFASFGKMGTGGWAKSDGLYCVRNGYDLQSKKFQNSFLKHEAQHFDDYERFPFIKEGFQTILEYRAKLVELIYGESLDTFTYLMNEATSKKDFPHINASRHIREEIQKKLITKNEKDVYSLKDIVYIQKVSLEIFNESTSELKIGKFLGKKLI